MSYAAMEGAVSGDSMMEKSTPDSECQKGELAARVVVCGKRTEKETRELRQL
jgi:hypothetical protein